MNDLSDIARWIMIAGAVITLIGALIWLAARFGIPLGNLPGDLRFGDENFRVYLPITTLLLINGLIWIVVWVVRRLSQ
ncbi:MAG: DUF2905 domain-containing protein [Planctomycetota bacterium]